MSGFILGVDPSKVDDTAEFTLGSRGVKHDGSEWMYLEAAEAIDPMDVVIVDLGGEALQLTATTGASGTGMGKQCAVVAETVSQDIVDGKFFWGCIYAPAVAGIKFNAVASVEDFTLLCASSTDGHLTDVLDLDAVVLGIVSAEADDIEPVGVINYPFVSDITQT
jgi:hypothetical protein